MSYLEPAGGYWFTIQWCHQGPKHVITVWLPTSRFATSTSWSQESHCVFRHLCRKKASLVAQLVKITCNAGDLGSIPGLGRSLGEEKGYPLQYSGLENSMDRMVEVVTELDTTGWPSLPMQGKWRKAAQSTSITLIRGGKPQNPSASLHHTGHIATTWLHLTVRRLFQPF